MGTVKIGNPALWIQGNSAWSKARKRNIHVSLEQVETDHCILRKATADLGEDPKCTSLLVSLQSATYAIHLSILHGWAGNIHDATRGNSSMEADLDAQ